MPGPAPKPASKRRRYAKPKSYGSATPTKPYVVAKGLLPTINGWARVHNPDFRLVELGGKYTDGGSTTVFAGANTLEVRVGMTADGES